MKEDMFSVCYPLPFLTLSIQVVDYLVDPFIAGTSGSDPDSVSVCLSLHFTICTSYCSSKSFQGPILVLVLEDMH